MLSFFSRHPNTFWFKIESSLIFTLLSKRQQLKTNYTVTMAQHEKGHRGPLMVRYLLDLSACYFSGRKEPFSNSLQLSFWVFKFYFYYFYEKASQHWCVRKCYVLVTQTPLFFLKKEPINIISSLVTRLCSVTGFILYILLFYFLLLQYILYIIFYFSKVSHDITRWSSSQV